MTEFFNEKQFKTIIQQYRDCANAHPAKATELYLELKQLIADFVESEVQERIKAMAAGLKR